MADIFISYKREDRERVARLSKALEEEGFSVWWDPELPLGQSYSAAIHGEINAAKVVLPVWTTLSVGSEWVQEEATQGKKRGVLIPLRLDAVDPPIGFGMVQTADLSKWRPGDRDHPEWRRLVEHVRARIEGRAPTFDDGYEAVQRPYMAGPLKVVGYVLIAMTIVMFGTVIWQQMGALVSALRAPQTESAAEGEGGGLLGAMLPSPSAAPPAMQAGVNATIAEARPLPLGRDEDGEIFSTEDTRYYRIDNKLKARDRIVIRLENKSATLKPDMKIYNAEKSQIAEPYDGTPGASVDYEMTAEPGEPIYVQVLAYNSTGKYNLSATPKKAYDAHEPNDDVLSPATLKFGETYAGNIMDDKDNDWIRVTGVSKPNLTVSFENLSTTLKPDVKVFDANKSNLMEKYDGTPGANLTFDVVLKTPGDFYLQVLPYNSTGEYKISVK